MKFFDRIQNLKLRRFAYVSFRVVLFLLPLIATALVYDSQRYFGHMIRGEIHVRWPYEFDKEWFGITTSDNIRMTLNEYWQLHTKPWLDFVTGVFYIAFIPIHFLIFALTLIYRRSSKKIERFQYALPWSFFWVNMLGYSTYYWFPAAPPWYVALKGLGPADVTTPPNVAGCARFDELVGIPIFANWYSKSADVFGAIPSLHIAYPFLNVLFAFYFARFRLTSLVYFGWMCFAAIYLNHHYVVDLLWGMVYSFLIYQLMKKWMNRKQTQQL